jgi:hypothetical protein
MLRLDHRLPASTPPGSLGEVLLVELMTLRGVIEGSRW